MLGFLFLVQNAMTKPTYNKISNVWEDNDEDRKFAHIVIILMLGIAFYLGTLF